MTSNNQNELCFHFGACGGCQFQDVPYAEQCRNKETMLEELFAEFWQSPISVEPSPVQWHYRNKVDPNFGFRHYEQAPPPDFERETVVGFKPKGRWRWPIDIEECRIGPNGFTELLAAVRSWYRDQGLAGYDNRRQTGFLRALLVREAKRTDQYLVVLITADGDFDRGSFVKTAQSIYPTAGIYRGIFRGLAEVAFADEMEHLAGPETVDEELHIPDGDSQRRLRFRLSPFSFFQTNTLATERLYGRIRCWVKESAPSILYDLYGGSGGIAFTCSDLVDHVYSVENVESASEDGRHNAAVNGIDNVEFFTEKVKNYLLERERAGGLHHPDNLVVVDPPRAGMHPKALRRLIGLASPEIIYVSCKPTVLATELPQFLQSYDIADMAAVDLFPHTRHVETLCRLVRRS